METRDKVSAAIIALPEHYAYIVFDEHVRAKTKLPTSTSPKASSPAPAHRGTGGETGDGLPCLPRHPRMLQRGGGKQHDEQFGRTTALRAPINEGPFHAIRIAPGVHHTMGGVTIPMAKC